jgi:SPP1 family predicted phage head-tail adaptor
MGAGARDRRLQLLRRTVVGKDDMGGELVTWPAIASVFAEREFASDGERMRADQAGASLTARFRIPWSSTWSSFDPTDRLLCERRLYDVTGVKELGRRKRLEITALARAETPADG